MKRMYVLTCLLFWFGLLKAQIPTVQWAKSAGSVDFDKGNSVISDYAGNVFTGGYFKGTVDFDPGPGVFNLTSYSSNYTDCFITKYDALGNFLWAVNFGGSLDDDIACITVDNAGDIYSVGRFKSNTDFDPGIDSFNLLSAGGSDIFVSKLDATGNFIWAKKIGGVYGESIRSIILDNIGQIYITGSFSGAVDFDPDSGTSILTSSANTYTDLFVCKLTANCNYVWAKNIGGSNTVSGITVQVDSQSNICIGGSFRGTADFDPDTTVFTMSAMGNADAFILKLNSSGDFLWVKKTSGSSQEAINSICFDSLNDLYIVGYFSGTVDFNPGSPVMNITSAGYYDMFILKLDTIGNFVWVKKIGGAGDDFGVSIALDGDGNIFTTGSFSETVDFDPGFGVFNLSTPTGGSETNIFLSKLNSSGGLYWAINIGDTEIDGGSSIFVDSSDCIYVTGSFSQSPDFANGNGIIELTSIGGWDIFTMKLTQSSVGIDEVKPQLVTIFPNPTNGLTEICFTTSSHLHIVEVYNALGELISEHIQPPLQKVVVNLANQPFGVYIIRITGKEGTIFERIIKN